MNPRAQNLYCNSVLWSKVILLAIKTCSINIMNRVLPVPCCLAATKPSRRSWVASTACRDQPGDLCGFSLIIMEVIVYSDGSRTSAKEQEMMMLRRTLCSNAERFAECQETRLNADGQAYLRGMVNVYKRYWAKKRDLKQRLCCQIIQIRRRMGGTRQDSTWIWRLHVQAITIQTAAWSGTAGKLSNSQMPTFTSQSI
jgi:hypothetical protein